MEKFWIWGKIQALDGSGDMYLVPYRCSDFEKYIWFELENSMWRKHRRTFQYHIKYIHNEIVKHFRVSILHYAERVREMQKLAK